MADGFGWLRAGHVSLQRVLLELKRSTGVGLRGLFPDADRTTGAHAFAEELVVRSAVAENFCYYQPRYDELGGAAGWAQETLAAHAGDARTHVYSLAAFEAGRTGEDLWNAAQMQLVHTGKLHGWARMYWAKKILEWSSSPAEALRIAIHLNDKYE